MTKYSPNPTAVKLRQLAPKCSVCGAELSNHRFAEIATTVASKDNLRRVRRLVEHVKEHRWSELTQYKDFRGDQNNVVVYAIRGPHSDGMVILIRDPFELFEPHEIYLQEQIRQEEIAAIAAIVGTDSWRDF